MNETVQYKIYVIQEDGTEVLYKNPIPNLQVLCTQFAQNNTIKIKFPFQFAQNSQIVLRGRNAVIELFSTELGSNFLLQTGAGVSGQKLCIGEKTTAVDNFHIHMVSSDRGVYIGKDCMISKNVQIWLSDGHAVFNDQGKIMNYCDKDVVIGNHVWLGANVTIGKGVAIQDNSIVGMCSVVTKDIPQNCTAVGNPAKVLYHGTSWDRLPPYKFVEDNKMEACKIIVTNQEGETRELKTNEKIENLNLVCGPRAKNNVIRLYEPFSFSKATRIDLRGENAEIILGSNKYIYNLNIITGTGTKDIKISFGKNCSMDSGFYINAGDSNCTLEIGEDCMFARNVTLYPCDGHVILDEEDTVLNARGHLKIGDHVWVGANSIFTKNAVVPSNSVVGAGSVVTKKYEDTNICIAGNPAAIVKRNISWKRERPYSYLEKDTGASSQKIVVVIPARYQSSRFPGKPLASILGKPMIQWVYEKVTAMNEIAEAYVATDDQRIYDTVIGFGGKAIMTGECSCGSERVYVACQDIDCDIVLNIQGDEPMIKTEMIRDLISAFKDPDVNMATLKKEITSEDDINNPNIAKLITDVNNDAIYFSRSTIPFNRDKIPGVKYHKHIGVYGYKKEFLKKFVELPHGAFEDAENLEQLRVIENGYKIRVVETMYDSIGVDLPEHIARVEEEMKKEGF